MKASSLSLAPLFLLAIAGNADAELPCRDCTPAAVDWTTLPSTYSHRDGLAVDQYEPGVVPVTYSDALRTTSIYRHHRSSLQGVNSADHYHRVDQFGPPVVPYGEWRYPYRPYSVPYGAWGPQLPQVYSPTRLDFHSRDRRFAPPGGAAFAPGPAGAMAPRGGYDPSGRLFDPRQGYEASGLQPLIPGPQNALPAAADEYYPEPPQPEPLSDRDFFYAPNRP